MAGNRYLAHALIRYLGPSGVNCALEHHPQFTPTEWEYCTLMDMDRAVLLLEQGLDPEQVEQQIWNETCQEQDQRGTPRFYQNIYSCKACTLKVLIAHANEPDLARSTMAHAQATNTALLLLSDRLDQRPIIAEHVPLKVRAAEIAPLLRGNVKST
jgi:hypothetical protein